MDDVEIKSEGQLTHEMWKFAERMFPFYRSDAWEGWKPKTPSEIVDTLTGLFEGLKKNPESEYHATGGLYVARELDDRNIYHFGFELAHVYFNYPFNDISTTTGSKV